MEFEVGSNSVVEDTGPDDGADSGCEMQNSMEKLCRCEESAECADDLLEDDEDCDSDVVFEV